MYGTGSPAIHMYLKRITCELSIQYAEGVNYRQQDWFEAVEVNSYHVVETSDSH